MKKIEIYTWSYCPFCQKAKSILESKNVEFVEFEISRDKSKLKELKKNTGSGSVPQIFVDGKFLGGCDELVAIVKKGDFEKLFK